MGARAAILGWMAGLAGLAGWVAGAEIQPPAIASRLKPEVLNRASVQREIMTHAGVEELGETGQRRYRIYATMLVHAEQTRVQRILTDYRLYKELVPYVEEATFEPASQVLSIAGGIWKFRMASSIRFQERAPGWIQYEILKGSFQGMKGSILFEARGEPGTLVFFDGDLTGHVPGPKFVLERGAEIVFGFTAGRMRSYIEKREETAPHDQGRNEIPQPRRRL